MPNDIKSDPDLLQRLHDAAGRPMTRDEQRAQKISFILGMMPHDSAITRGQVEQIVDRSEGKAA